MEEVARLDKECWICETCGVQFAPSSDPPAECHICVDERQFVPKGGQRWTKQEQLKQRGYRNMYQKHEQNLYGIATVPKFGIGQRAFLLQTPNGNLLCDCVTFLDDATIDIIKGLGGLRAIAISHPHFYSANAQWSAAFGNIPVYMHEKDRKWAGYDHENVSYWSGETLSLWDGIQLVRLGGHFPGGSILHWPSGADGKGAVISGDILQVTMDRKAVSVMRSFPNYIPLSGSHSQRISKIMETLEYDRLYGAFFDLEIETNAKALVRNSLQRYVHWLQSDDTDI
ncbi:hypothetical protein MPTK1_4g07340 [Marchantia polymorpha subsp. ruderalis]|uniref:Metallo-beta-lactamase domain-containing protein n=2 Tax=Marchantia polymorpha TaxID=3197 RepID=A0A176VQA1_MARPO|nr:hypothetical protein AXG93_1544s1100 [Marchantia polymorpha subsp. ruderalis]PTQ31130.1 hypothetical protein MARPO_0115s0047 [Marchantia polymorpha]BBN07924.1 hypothetical protein Mp_4g07340 [Marchantia polymorpha subsp. ruderalis]|eukprot:PTQ31130.1 hypothetical protein MARPO_0115s0047 [Marchantia polymorpha]